MPLEEIINPTEFTLSLKNSHFFKLMQSFSALPYMGEMFLNFTTLNQYVIKINSNKFSNICLQNMIHHSHKGTWGINKSEWHYQPLIQPLLCLKCCFPLISWSNVDLMITTSEVNPGKHFCSCHQVERCRLGTQLPNKNNLTD